VLRTDDARYDVIVADLYHPWTAGAGALFSLDHYRLARARLAPGGLFCHWLPLHQIPVDDLQRVIATFLAAFPHTQLWLGYHRATTTLAALVGSEAPLAPDATAIKERLENPAVRASAAPAGLDGPLDLAVLYVASEEQLAPPVADVPPMTDDRPVIEFDAAAAYFDHEQLPRATLRWLAARLAPGDGPIAGAPASFALRAKLAEAQIALFDADGRAELRAYLEALPMAPQASAVRQPLTAIAARLRAAGDVETADLVAGALEANR
jgi:spermidine synthase